MQLRHFFLLLAVAFVLFFHHLGQRDLWSSHEARAAQNARSVLVDGQWLVPHLFDAAPRPELQKPPLYYWLAALCSWPGGEVTATTTRLPAVLGALVCLLFVYSFCSTRAGGVSRPCGAAIGLLAALVLATFVRFTWLARVGRIDMPLTAAVTVALVCFWRGGWWQIPGYLAVAAGVLLKGPIGLVLPAVVGAGWWGGKRILTAETQRNAEKSGLRSLWWGVPLVLAVVLPWYFAANAHTQGKFFDEFVWKHNLQRGLGGDEQLDGHDHPAWFYLVQVWPDTLPWSLLLPTLLWSAWHRRRQLEPLEAFGLVWFVSIFAFLSLMRYKRPDYLLPAYPGLSLFMGYGVHRWLAGLSEARRTLATRFGGVALGIWLAGWVVYVDAVLPRWEPARSLRAFAAAVRKEAGDHLVLTFRVDSHQLTWHLGKPTGRLWEWENLEVWATGGYPCGIVMTEAAAKEWAVHLQRGKLQSCFDTWQFATDLEPEERLVFFTVVPKPKALQCDTGGWWCE